MYPRNVMVERMELPYADHSRNYPVLLYRAQMCHVLHGLVRDVAWLICAESDRPNGYSPKPFAKQWQRIGWNPSAFYSPRSAYRAARQPHSLNSS